MADRVGQSIDRYRLTRLIGQGEFGEVYLGKHLRHNNQVAIKVLNTQLTNVDKKDFDTTGRTIKRLEHRNLLQVLDFGDEDGFPFLIMNYFPDGSLRQRHPRGTRLLPETIVPYVRQVADALQYAHDQKLIHRDVKPENMLLGGNNEVLLSDFGLALIPRSSRLIGTVEYMAPEQIQGKLCPASDQYALGIVVYEWISGTLPFNGSYNEIITQHLSVPPLPMRTKVPALPPDIDQVVLIALKKDPKERFASVKAFANALEQACKSEPYLPPARTPSYTLPPNPLPVPSTFTPSQSQTWLERNISRRSLVVLLGTAIAVGAGVSVWGYVSNAHGPGTTHISVPGHTTPPTPTIRRPLVYRGHKGEVKAVAWSPDGQRIASGSGDRTVQVWEAAAGQTLFTYRGHTDEVKAVAWSPQDGKYIASGSTDMTVQVWEATTGKFISTYRGHTAGVRTVAWSPDGKMIASGAGQDNTHHDDTVQVWNATRGDHIFTYRGHTNQVVTIAWSPGGTRIASASFDKKVRVWNATNGQDVLFPLAHSAGVRGVTWSPDGAFIASGGDDNKVYVWDAKTGQMIRSYPGHTGSVQSVAWSPDGKYIASGSFDHTVKVWKVTTGQNVYTYTHHMDQVWSVAWSPDGQYITSASKDGTVRVWQAR